MTPCDDAVLDLLSSEAMRREILPFAQAREDFQAEVAGPWSWSDVQEEVTRFIGHVNKRLYASRSQEEWPHLLAERDSDDILEATFGPTPRRAVMSLAQQKGIRALLDVLTRRLQEQRLQTYFETRVRLRLADLSPEDRYKLAQQYLSALRQQLGGGLAHGFHFIGPTADTLCWWQTTLQEHGRLFLAME